MAASLNAFYERCEVFLAGEAQAFSKDGRPDLADEIIALRADHIMLSPDGSTGGMIYFDGGERGRVWRCDRDLGEPVDLGFDS